MPATTRAALERLAARFLLAACVSGRAGSDAAALVGADGVTYVGNHGLELHPGRDAAREEIAAFRSVIGSAWSIEDKGLSLSLHFREAADEAQARAALETIAGEARARGLDARWGRKVLEIRPLIDADKGTAVTQLLAASGATRAMYAGDDATDLDAFSALDASGLRDVVRVAVDSPEAPPALLAAADAVVASPGELAGALTALTTP